MKDGIFGIVKGDFCNNTNIYEFIDRSKTLRALPRFGLYIYDETS